MKIIFDATSIATNKKTGVGYYSEQLLKSLASNYMNDIKVVAYYYNFLSRNNYSLPEYENVIYKQIRLVPVQLVNLLRRLHIEIPVELLAKSRGDVAIFPNFLAQPSIFKMPKYIVLHDLSYIDHPEYVSDKNRHDLLRFVPKSIKRSRKIVTVSEVSKNTIANFYNITPNNILVTPIPPEKKVNLTNDEVSMVQNAFEIKKPYLLYLGTLEPRKNIINLIEAYCNNKMLYENYSLVLAGKMDWKYEEIAQSISKKQEEGYSIIYCGYVSNTQRAALYSGASVFVFPSLYEGFGMMILESMQYKVPVAISDIPVFHEVAKNSAAYFDPKNSDNIASVISDLLQNKKISSGLIDTYDTTLDMYSWKDNADKIINEIRDVA
jgi:glycosyltransferase involved in cell wall biosynthesis